MEPTDESLNSRVRRRCVAPLSSETGINYPLKPRPSKSLASGLRLRTNNAIETMLSQGLTRLRLWGSSYPVIVFAHVFHFLSAAVAHRDLLMCTRLGSVSALEWVSPRPFVTEIAWCVCLGSHETTTSSVLGLVWVKWDRAILIL